ncbi:unannotated protein [freshwater metagenome]|uniref:phosphoribosylglycinamide formyltransferase 1 n=1 Tax=freshwater metagenome TaxID=449393 RepID=A0A6J7XYD4_9ZZZZ|nr:phosphoribosylglycinamide formyltransferase [Actinomycetota bacterium]
MTKSIAILASGAGSLASAIINAVRDGELEVNIVGIICDQPSAPVVDVANKAGIKIYLVPMQSDRAQWDDEILSVTERLVPDLVVSAGFMRILSPAYVDRFKVINTHPALLPNFPGAHAVRDALAADVKRTGATVHWVDAGVDTGKVISQCEVDVLPNDTENSLHERIKMSERTLIVETISQLVPLLEKNHE